MPSQVLDAVDFMHWGLPGYNGPGTGQYCLHRDVSPGAPFQSKCMPATTLVIVSCVMEGASQTAGAVISMYLQATSWCHGPR